MNRSTDTLIPAAPEIAASAPSKLRRIADLPGPRPLPFFGNTLALKSERIHQDIEQMCREYGRFFKIHFGPQPILVVADHEAVSKILKARPHDFARSPRFSDRVRELGLDLGLFMAEGERWQYQRRMVMASFAPQRIRSYFPSMLGVAGRLKARWDVAARTQTPIELQGDLMRYTVDTITGLAFGQDVNSLQAEGSRIQQHLDMIFPAIFRRVLTVVPYWRMVKLPRDHLLERSIAEVNVAIDRFVAEARARMQEEPSRRAEPSNLLEALIVASEAEDSNVTDHDVKANVLTMLLAGEDTTANTLAWMLTLMYRSPETLARAREEVGMVAPGGLADLTPETLGRMDYVEACAHEAMRLKPVAPFLPVQALRDTTVGEIDVPAGSLIWNVLRHDSVSEALIPEATRFMPERWLQAHNPAKQASIPFGSGARICPGRYLALLEIKMAMAMLLSHFDIVGVDTPDGQAAQEQMAFTMQPVGLTMRLRQR